MPLTMKQFFWDVDFDSIDPQHDSWFVIERILSVGEQEHFEWLLSNYQIPQIRQNLLENYNLSPQAVRQWAPTFDLNPQQCKCMNKPSVLHVFG